MNQISAVLDFIEESIKDGQRPETAIQIARNLFTKESK